MTPPTPRARLLGLFLLELGVYGAVVWAYVELVLRFLGTWLVHLFEVNKTGYALVAMVLIVGQGFFLERVTGALWRVLCRTAK